MPYLLFFFFHSNWPPISSLFLATLTNHGIQAFHVYHFTTRYFHYSWFSISTWKNSVKPVIGGVGMLIGPRTIKSRNSIEKIQLRMMVATFNADPSTTIISRYSPNNINEETGLIALYNVLLSLVRCIPKHKVLIISWGMNAQIGKNVNNNFSLHTPQIEMGNI